MEMSQEPFCVEMYRKNAAHSFRARHFDRACALEMHMDFSQELFFAVIYRKKCRTLLRPPRLNTVPLTLTVRTPAVWPHCLGKSLKNLVFHICDMLKQIDALQEQVQSRLMIFALAFAGVCAAAALILHRAGRNVSCILDLGRQDDSEEIAKALKECVSAEDWDPKNEHLRHVNAIGYIDVKRSKIKRSKTKT